MSQVEIALSYLRAGLCVLPAILAAKRPALRVVAGFPAASALRRGDQRAGSPRPRRCAWSEARCPATSRCWTSTWPARRFGVVGAGQASGRCAGRSAGGRAVAIGRLARRLSLPGARLRQPEAGAASAVGRRPRRGRDRRQGGSAPARSRRPLVRQPDARRNARRRRVVPVRTVAGLRIGPGRLRRPACLDRGRARDASEGRLVVGPVGFRANATWQ